MKYDIKAILKLLLRTTSGYFMAKIMKAITMTLTTPPLRWMEILETISSPHQN